MKLVIDNGAEIYECTKIIKGEDYIHVYEGDMLSIAFEGINDFIGYAVEDGEFSDPEPTKEEILQTQLDKLQAQVEMLTKMLMEKEA